MDSVTKPGGPHEACGLWVAYQCIRFLLNYRLVRQTHLRNKSLGTERGSVGAQGSLLQNVPHSDDFELTLIKKQSGKNTLTPPCFDSKKQEIKSPMGFRCPPCTGR